MTGSILGHVGAGTFAPLYLMAVTVGNSRVHGNSGDCKGQGIRRERMAPPAPGGEGDG